MEYIIPINVQENRDALFYDHIELGKRRLEYYKGYIFRKYDLKYIKDGAAVLINGEVYMEGAKWSEDNKYEVKDSGKREEFSTGAVRDTQEGKGRFDLIPGYPLERLAKLYQAGAIKYSDKNWEKGMKTSRCLDSLLRHANKVKMGMEDEDHLSAIVFNAFAIIQYRQMIAEGKLPKELDDLKQ